MGEEENELALKRSLYAKYGGVHFVQEAPTKEINDYVRTLSADKRDNLFEVLHHLDMAGLISIQNDNEWVDPYGEAHPTHPHDQNERES